MGSCGPGCPYSSERTAAGRHDHPVPQVEGTAVLTRLSRVWDPDQLGTGDAVTFGWLWGDWRGWTVWLHKPSFLRKLG